ncbi:MAG TPA: hypothetical protein VEL76_08735 [Gemmataceae bacterium]|nr:hypothetical protein [Gemmataceae bacterium]
MVASTSEQVFDPQNFLLGLKGRGIQLEREGDKLHVWPAILLTARDRETIRGHKSLILQTLPQNDKNGKNDETTNPPVPGNNAKTQVRNPWDQAAAEQLLADLRATVRRLKREDFRGCPPAIFEVLAANTLGIAKDYLRDHELEAARGWDVLDLLQEQKQVLLEIAERLKTGVT